MDDIARPDFADGRLHYPGGGIGNLFDVFVHDCPAFGLYRHAVGCQDGVILRVSRDALPVDFCVSVAIQQCMGHQGLKEIVLCIKGRRLEGHLPLYRMAQCNVFAAVGAHLHYVYREGGDGIANDVDRAPYGR